jgi:adenylate kinase family enzyme
MSHFTRQFTAQQLLDLPPVDVYFNDKQFIKVQCKFMKEASEYSCDDIISIKRSISTEVEFNEFVITFNSIRSLRSLSGNASFEVTWLISSVLASGIIVSANQIGAERIEAFCVGNSIRSFSIDNQWMYNPKLFQFSANLRKQYEVSQQTPPPVQWIPSPTRKIFRLAMIKREGVQRGHIMGDRFVQMTISGRVDDILHAKSSLKLENIFRDTTTSEIILIEGAPGSGKSTLAVHICQRWGKGELFQQFTVAILVQLRDPAVQRAQTIADLLPVENMVAIELADDLKSTSGRGLLWVFDGWDELPAQLQQNSVFVELIERRLSECSVVVTSRPISSADLHPIVSSRIEVLGFTPEEQTDYFTECFKEDTKALESLLEKIKENPMVQSICYLPLNAAFIVYTFKYKDQFLPNTEYEIYLSIILSCIQRHFEREGRGHYLPRDLSSLDDLSRNEAVREPFQRLCELAYHGVMENKVTFSSIDLPQGSSTLSLLQAIESFLQSGKSLFYNFLHLSIQEVLSGYYIATQLSESDQVSQFQQLFDHPRFAVVFQFYAAITKLKSPGIHQVIAITVDAGSKPLLVSLFRCLYEAQDPSLCSYVAERLKYQLSLEDMFLSPLDCLSISFFPFLSGNGIYCNYLAMLYRRS